MVDSRILLPFMVVMIYGIEPEQFPRLVFKKKWEPINVMVIPDRGRIQPVASTAIDGHLAFLSLQTSANKLYKTLLIHVYADDGHLKKTCGVVNIISNITLRTFNTFNDTSLIISWTDDVYAYIMVQAIDITRCTKFYSIPANVKGYNYPKQQVQKVLVIPYKNHFDLFWEPYGVGHICKKRYHPEWYASDALCSSSTHDMWNIAPLNLFNNHDDLCYVFIDDNKLNISIKSENGIVKDGRVFRLKARVINFDHITLNSGYAVCALEQGNSGKYIECINFDKYLNIRSKAIVSSKGVSNQVISIKQYSADKLLIFESCNDEKNEKTHKVIIYMLSYKGIYSKPMVFDSSTCNVLPNINLQYMGSKNSSLDFCSSYACSVSETMSFVHTKCLTSSANKVATVGMTIFLTFVLISEIIL